MVTTGIPTPPSARPRATRHRTLVTAAVVGGVALDVGIRGYPANLATAVCGLAVLTAIAVHRPARSGPDGWIAATTVALLVMLAVRVSPWLTLANGLGAVTLLLALAMRGSGLRFVRSTPAQWHTQLGATLAHAGSLPARIGASLPAVDGRRRRVLRRVVGAALLAAPLLGIVVALLVSADPVFAGLVLPDRNPWPPLGHMTLAVIGTLVALALAVGSRASAHSGTRAGFRQGRIETVTMLALAAAVLVAFVVAQLVATTGPGHQLLRDAGTTPARYARQGFFQLCWAALVIVGFLTLVRRLTTPAVLRAAPVRVLATAVPALALGLVVVSLRRLALYDDAFGMTWLRLAASAATVWIGLVLVLLAVRNAARPGGRWVAAVAVGLAISIVLGADLANPEAWIVRHDAARAAAGADVDLDYLATLSDDAVPQLARTLRARPAARSRLVCQGSPSGISRANVSVQDAEAVRSELCHSVLNSP